ncbi:putative disease resistance protein RGA1 [Tasmannia lanceolata]|uniref:putative disease resistance protein RGA1 n=1 Tax=Tasmannia lanceolata TaxID=3420 RepID=UPI0040639239
MPTEKAVWKSTIYLQYLLTSAGKRLSLPSPSLRKLCKLKSVGKNHCLQILVLFPTDLSGMGSSDVPPTLIAIGKDIAKKCKGLPLPMEALGGLLRTNTNENRGKNILKSDMWEISEMEKNIIPILKVRYDNLPAYLKQCFVYCSLYPKDYKFEKDTLIQLWIAEGFIQPEGRK